MPQLPSGRRVEFSLDRFHAMLEQMEPTAARSLIESIQDANDLLWVLDLVCFDGLGRPHFAECVAADWQDLAREWSEDDRAAFDDYLSSEAATGYRAEAIEGTRVLLGTRLMTPQAASAFRFAA
jgi:hypothetical protein